MSIHPVVRAIALHVWLAYDHPSCDGNGRAAWALSAGAPAGLSVSALLPSRSQAVALPFS